MVPHYLLWQKIFAQNIRLCYNRYKWVCLSAY